MSIAFAVLATDEIPVPVQRVVPPVERWSRGEEAPFAELNGSSGHPGEPAG